MTDWQWECFERYTHSGVFAVTDAGPLLSPIRSFTITRNRKLGLVLETEVVGEAQAGIAPILPNGTVRRNTERVEFTGNGGSHCTAQGVFPFNTSETQNAEWVRKTSQKSQVHSLTALIRKDITPTYTIDWLSNLDRGLYVWRGSSICAKSETNEILTLGHGAGTVKLSTNYASMSTTNFSALQMVIAGVRLFLCDCAPESCNEVDRPGYIFYVGSPTDEIRTKIRQVLSFSLGNYLIYLGSTMLSEKSEVVSFSAVSPPSIGRVSEIPALPPTALGKNEMLIAEEQVVTRMANALYAHYDELRFDSFSWTYWHAMCAPVHMAASHFGAAIEALQNAYMEAHPAKFDKTLITDKAKWAPLKEAFLKVITEAEVEPTVSDILTNRVVANLNQMPPSLLSEKVLGEIGIALGEVETAAWRRRNIAAHGGRVDLDSAIPTIRETKVLKIILHRMVLKISGASDRYYDDYSLGHSIRDVKDPIPPPPREPETAA